MQMSVDKVPQFRGNEFWMTRWTNLTYFLYVYTNNTIINDILFFFRVLGNHLRQWRRRAAWWCWTGQWAPVPGASWTCSFSSQRLFTFFVNYITFSWKKIGLETCTYEWFQLILCKIIKFKYHTYRCTEFIKVILTQADYMKHVFFYYLACNSIRIDRLIGNNSKYVV